MCALDFFDFLIREDENYNKLIINNENLNSIFNNNLSHLIKLLTDKISLIYGTKEFIDQMDEDQIIEIDDVVNISVRKSSALLLENLAWNMPEFVFNNSNHVIEQGINSSNPIEKYYNYHNLT